MPKKTDWPLAMKPLLKKYKNHPHPLDYKNIYQLLVQVVLSAQSTDDIINKISPAFFEKLPNMQALSRASEETLYPLIAKVRNFRNKASWLMQIAKQVKKDSHIPLTLDELTELPGIGRKSANVILREAGKPAEGVIVDIHVVRVAPRLGIANGTDPKKIEQQLMVALPQQQWDAGMAMSFLGRDICRPKPLCPECLMRPVCAFYQANKHILQFTSSKNKR
ncbi:MAG TPA: endonuclease III [Chitinophagaceae bacterium]|nr:endonuclease III [Chitinophagaceae bacterium]